MCDYTTKAWTYDMCLAAALWRLTHDISFSQTGKLWNSFMVSLPERCANVKGAMIDCFFCLYCIFLSVTSMNRYVSAYAMVEKKGILCEYV